MSELVREIVDVNAFLDRDEDGTILIVEAEAMAPTAGWTQVRLKPHVYITPPDDGLQDFDLVGDRPADAAADALTPVEAAWEGPLAEWLVGVRVHAVDNLIEEDVFDIGDDYDDSDEATEQDGAGEDSDEPQVEAA